MVAGLGLLLSASSAHAQGQPQLNTYVSDEFKAVARRAFGQLVADQITNACPKGKPLCQQVVKRLSAAFEAALSNDEAGLRLALNGFFLDASVNALLESTTGGILSEISSKTLATALDPAMRCLSTSVAGERGLQACTLSPTEKSQLVQALKVLSCKGGDCQTRDTIAQKVAQGSIIKPGDVVRLLVILASSEEVERPDLRIFLLKLEAVLNEGTSQGLFEPVLAFLSKEAPGLSHKAIIDFDPAAPLHETLTSDKDADILAALQACQQPLEPFTNWQAIRSTDFMLRLREQLLTGAQLDLEPVRKLLEYKPCAADKATALRDFKRKLRYLFAPLIVHDVLTRYGVPGLSAAALIDYVRTSDAVQLERNVERTLLFGVAQVAVQVSTQKKLAAERTGGAPVRVTDMLPLRQALGSCEIQTAAALYGVRIPGQTPGPQCFSVVSEQQVNAPTVPTNTAGVPRAQWLQANAPTLLATLRPTLQEAVRRAQDLPFFEGINSTTLLMAAEQLGDGNVNAAQRTMVRFGVDLLAARTDEFATRIVGNDGEKCLEDSRSIVLFDRVGAACAAHLLIRSAYHPIADYYWQHGIAESDLQPLSRSVYRELLASPLLDHTPLILNVGLGTNYVYGHRDVWGTNGYLALTVVDKFGVAVYKYSDKKTVFETGLFVGGFLDALIRTAINEGEEQRYWLFGWTLGWPRIGGLNMGLEAHLAAAMPFPLSDGHRYGLVGGLTVVVPFNTVLTPEDK